MKLIDVIDQAQPWATGLVEPRDPFNRHRQAVRAVVSDDVGRIYMLKVAAKGGYYKLPGGGVDPGEYRIEALHREMMEEIGYEIKVGAPVGRVAQYEETAGFRHDSDCYLGRIVGGDGQTHFTDEEQADGFAVVVFDDIAAAIAALADVSSTDPKVHVMTRRDLALLRSAATQ